MLKKYLPIKIKAIYNRFHEIGPIPFSGGNLWVKKTKFSKTSACLFIFHFLITEGKIKKNNRILLRS